MRTVGLFDRDSGPAHLDGARICREVSRGAPQRLNQPDSQISMMCEEILLSEGRWREAYDRYALEANRQARTWSHSRHAGARHIAADLGRPDRVVAAGIVEPLG